MGIIFVIYLWLIVLRSILQFCFDGKIELGCAKNVGNRYKKNIDVVCQNNKIDIYLPEKKIITRRNFPAFFATEKDSIP